MKNVARKAIGVLLVFFVFLLINGYVQEGYSGMKEMIADPFNWIIIAVVILASYGARIYRRKRRAKKESYQQ